jgi:phosphohistidine phosphatase
MKLLVIRHAIAEDRDEFAKTGEEDGLRPLTKVGKKKMRSAANGLIRIVPELHVLATSPLTRAAQTADIVAEAYGRLRPSPQAALAPGKKPSAILAWLQDQRPDLTIAIVGHEPDLGLFVSWMLTGLQESFLEFKKGGASLLDLGENPKPGRAKLVWVMKPSQLRALA